MKGVARFLPRLDRQVHERAVEHLHLHIDAGVA